jgi:hypothetical protein
MCTVVAAEAKSFKVVVVFSKGIVTLNPTKGTTTNSSLVPAVGDETVLSPVVMYTVPVLVIAVITTLVLRVVDKVIVSTVEEPVRAIVPRVVIVLVAITISMP